VEIPSRHYIPTRRGGIVVIPRASSNRTSDQTEIVGYPADSTFIYFVVDQIVPGWRFKRRWGEGAMRDCPSPIRYLRSAKTENIWTPPLSSGPSRKRLLCNNRQSQRIQKQSIEISSTSCFHSLNTQIKGNIGLDGLV